MNRIALSLILAVSTLCCLAPAVPAQGTAAIAAAAQAVAPGRDLSPQFSDPVRVGVILDLVSKVYNGQPLPFPKDGTVFQNRDGTLPAKPQGYYREYTVLPPRGSPTVVTVGEQTFSIKPAPPGNRGAERLIIGGGEVLYYTPDHYKTFIQLQVVR